MRSLNDFADKLPRSYKTAANAQRALDSKVDSSASTGKGGTLIVQRTDGRFAVLVVNPDSGDVGYYIHNGIAVFGVIG